MRARALAQREHKRKLVRRSRRKRSTLLISATLLACTAVLAVLADRLFLPSAFRVDQLRLEGSFEHVDPQKLRNVVVSALDGNFFAIDLERIERTVSGLPWVYRVDVRRVWPDSIHVKIIEQQPVARWGPQQWLNADGEVIALSPTPDLQELVRLDGPDGSSEKVLERYRNWHRVLAKAGLKIKWLVMSPRRAWTLTLLPMGWGISDPARQDPLAFEVLLGNRDLDSRLQRFIRSYQVSLSEQVNVLERVDLRYPNGLAVSRRSEPNSSQSNLTSDSRA